MGFGLLGSKVLKGVSVGTTNTTVAHGLPFVPRVYAIVPKDALATVRWVSSDATNITLVASAAVTVDVLIGPDA